jgi:hypothetical protein
MRSYATNEQPVSPPPPMYAKRHTYIYIHIYNPNPELDKLSTNLSNLLLVIYFTMISVFRGARGSVVSSGTMLQAGRWPVRVPDEVDFSIYLILSAALWPSGRLSLWQKWVPGIFLGLKGGRRIRLTTLPPSVSLFSRENVGASTSHNPSRPVRGIVFQPTQGGIVGRLVNNELEMIWNEATMAQGIIIRAVVWRSWRIVRKPSVTTPGLRAQIRIMTSRTCYWNADNSTAVSGYLQRRGYNFSHLQMSHTVI